MKCSARGKNKFFVTVKRALFHTDNDDDDDDDDDKEDDFEPSSSYSAEMDSSTRTSGFKNRQEGASLMGKLVLQ